MSICLIIWRHPNVGVLKVLSGTTVMAAATRFLDSDLETDAMLNSRFKAWVSHTLPL